MLIELFDGRDYLERLLIRDRDENTRRVILENKIDFIPSKEGPLGLAMILLRNACFVVLFTGVLTFVFYLSSLFGMEYDPGPWLTTWLALSLMFMIMGGIFFHYDIITLLLLYALGKFPKGTIFGIGALAAFSSLHFAFSSAV